MPWLFLAPAAIAVVLSIGSGPALVIGSIVNAVLSFYAINTMLNLGTQLADGSADYGSYERYKSGAVAVWTLTFVVAVALIIVGVAS